MSNPSLSKKILQSTIIGYVLAIILTVAAYLLVVNHTFPADSTFVILGILALVQLFVQLFLFVRINSGSDAGWNFIVLLFTIIVIVIVVCGSLWIMYNLNYNMVH